MDRDSETEQVGQRVHDRLVDRLVGCGLDRCLRNALFGSKIGQSNRKSRLSRGNRCRVQ